MGLLKAMLEQYMRGDHYISNSFLLLLFLQNSRNPQLWKYSWRRLSGKPEVGPYGRVYTIWFGPYRTVRAF